MMGGLPIKITPPIFAVTLVLVGQAGSPRQRLSIPAGAFAGRRLDASCGEMEVQVTEWLSLAESQSPLGPVRF